jgi:thioredoxin 2
MTDTPSTAGRPAIVPCAACAKLNRVDFSRVDQKPKCGVCGKPLVLDQPLALTDATFARVIRDASVPVMVDFYADWCAPCRMMAPAYAELARRYSGQALIVKLDTEHNQATASRFGIRGIPTVIVFRGDREAKRQVGALPLQGLEQLLQSAL